MLEEVSLRVQLWPREAPVGTELAGQRSSSQGGLTLLELMVAIAILGILVVVAVPSFRDLLAQQRIKGAAELVQTDLMFARSEAVRRNSAVYVKLTTGADGCLGIGTAVCSCRPPAPSGAALCDIKTTDLSPTGGAFPGVQLSAATATDLTFTAIRGAPDVINPEISLASTDITPSRQVTVKLSLLGLTSACSPNGSVGGLSAC